MLGTQACEQMSNSLGTACVFINTVPLFPNMLKNTSAILKNVCSNPICDEVNLSPAPSSELERGLAGNTASFL